ncbi:unnamed protein product [Kuraishia capsulata CBS 1993]|uniref:Vesicle tethering protein Uso1/P115-like head domain-containing protein n=1 Tax=Kuraishia capsulata CBS 1993 TaxID=1382522 RepID=W6MUL7_9ASCO|nr:uncharacterized protein KUCA_T00001710001 [Kuraishia capsulata CBS 1993]CDK25740.1 unnamed protein product [Kuraishia capsulata CBS 1993]
MDLLANFMAPVSASAKEVENSIGTLSDRLAHSTLLTDRRAAVLGLKSYSRQYRENVIASGLKALLATLKSDLMDTEICKAILETLLILFIRGEGDQDLTRNWISQQSRTQNGKYPSPSLLMSDVTVDQFSMWIADALTQSPDNVFLLIQILESEDFYLRLYALQLLEALCSVRPVRTKECVLKFPVGVSTIIGVLDDVNEPIRNESILLLMGLVNDNYNIQKLVAFENTFDKLYEIIDSEGGIEGSIVVQDCLSLIMNLLKFNASNQKLFLETNCIPKLLQLLNQPLTVSEYGPLVWNEQRVSNVTTCLETCRLLLIEGSDSVHTNQEIMVSSNILMVVLKLVFSAETPNPVRSTALLTTSDIIKGNPDIQLQFSQIDVPYLDPVLPTQTQNYDDLIPVNVALLNWCLFSNSVHVFDIRVASSVVLHAYFAGNVDAKEAFIEDQWISFQKLMGINVEEKDDASSLEDQQTNGDTKEELTVSASNTSSAFDANSPQGNLFYTLTKIEHDSQLNPYKFWFAAVMLLYLFEDCPGAKEIAMGVKLGGENEEEDVMTFIQAASYALSSSLNYSDQRISIAYLMMLIVWLYEDFEAVDMFLADESIIDQLLAYLAQTSTENVLVQGLVTILLGVSYEFCRSTSPIPRAQLHSILVSRLGKTTYVLKVLQFQKQTPFHDFDPAAIYDPERDITGLPKVLFDALFVNLVKDNFTRIRGAINHDPNVEPVQKISFEAYEKVEDQLAEISSAFEAFRTEKLEEIENNEATIVNLKDELSDLKESHTKSEDELSKLREAHTEVSTQLKEATQAITAVENYNEDLSSKCSDLQKQLEAATSKAGKLEHEGKTTADRLAEVEKQKVTAENGINKMSRELFQLTREKDAQEKSIKNLEKELAKSSKAQEKLESTMKTAIKQKEDRIASLENQLNSMTTALKSAGQDYAHLEAEHSECGEKLTKADESNRQLMDKLRSAAELIEKFKKTDNESKKHIVELESSSSSLIKELEDQLSEIKLQRDSFKEKHVSVLEELGSTKEKLMETVSKHESLSEALKKQSSEFESIKAAFEAAQAEKAELLSQKKKLENELSSLKQKHSDFSNQSETLTRELSDLKSSHEQLLGEKIIHDSAKAELDSQIASLNAKIAEFEASQAADKKDSDALSQKYEGLLAEHDRFTAESEKSSVELKESHATAISKLKSEIESHLEMQAAKDSKTKELSAKIQDLQSLIETKDKELKRLNKENSELNTKLKAIEKENEKLTSELNIVKEVSEKKESTLKAEVAKFKERSTSLAEEKASLNSTIEMISQNIQSKEEETTKFSKDISELKKALADAESEKTSSLEELAAIKVALTEAQAKVERSQSDSEASKEEFKKLSNSHKSLESKLTNEKEVLTEKISKLQSEISKLHEELTQKSKEIDDERKMLVGSSESAVKEYSDKIAALGDKLSNSERINSAKISDLEDLNEKLKSQTKQLSLQIEQLKADLVETKTKNEDLEKKMVLSKSTSDKLLEKLKTDLKASKSENAENIKSIGDKDDLLQKLQAETKEYQNLKEAHATTSAKVKSLEDELASKTVKIEEHLASFKTSTDELNSLQTELKDSKQHFENSKSTIEKLEKEKLELSAHVEEIEKSQKSGNADAAKQVASLEQKTSTLQDSLNEEKSKYLTLAKELEGTKSDLQKSVLEVETLKKKITETEVAKSDFEALLAKHNELEVLNKDLSAKLMKSSTKLSENEQEHSQTVKALEAAQKELSAVQSKQGSAEKASADKDKQILELQESLKKSQLEVSKMVPKSELDDMMLLMSELDDKSKKYKDMASKLGAEVSSDEEDDDDDDDEDEDEE